MASAPPASSAAAPTPPGATEPYATTAPSLPPAHPLQLRDYPARTVWRCHRLDPATGKYPSYAFNAGGRGDARFSPIFDSAGTVIPTMYAATEARTCIAEVVLHDMPADSHGFVFDMAQETDPSKGHMVSQVKLPALKLVPLTSLHLLSIGLTVPQLIGGNSDRYPHTRAWARWIHENMRDAQGLYWMSRRDDENGCMLLFGDRIPAGAVTEVATAPLGAYRLELLELLDALGAVVI